MDRGHVGNAAHRELVGQLGLHDHLGARLDAKFRDGYVLEGVGSRGHADPLEDERRSGLPRNGPRVAQQPGLEQGVIARVVLQRREDTGQRDAFGDLRIPIGPGAPVIGDQPARAGDRLLPYADEEVDDVGREDAPQDQAERVRVQIERALHRRRP